MKTPTDYGYQLWLGAHADHIAELTARYITTRLRLWLQHNPHVLLLLSGGTSPIPLFRALAASPIDWTRVTLSLVDERWVPATHRDSNQLLIEEHLISPLADPPQFIPLYSSNCNVEHVAERLQRVFAPLNEWPTLAVLGMGDDGHTASLFPDAPEFAEALTTQRDWIAVTPTQAPHPRVSVSLHRLIECHERLLYLPSEEKLARFKTILTTDEHPSPLRKLIQLSARPLQVFSLASQQGNRHDTPGTH